VTFVSTVNHAAGKTHIPGAASVFVDTLDFAGYSAERTDSSATTVYEPQSGWYHAGAQTYRITGAHGTVEANTSTLAVRSANVAWDLTTRVGNYASYALARLHSNEPKTETITYEFDPGDQHVTRLTRVSTHSSGWQNASSPSK